MNSKSVSRSGGVVGYRFEETNRGQNGCSREDALLPSPMLLPGINGLRQGICSCVGKSRLEAGYQERR